MGAGGMVWMPELQAVGWALIHSLWQGALVALLLAALLWLTRGREAELRYGLASLGLAAILALPLLTGASMLAEWREHDACWAMAEDGAGYAAVEAAGCLGHGLHMLFEQHDMASTGQAAGAPAALPVHVRVSNAVRVASLDYTGPVALLGAGWLLAVTLLGLRTAAAWRRTRRLVTHGTEPAPRPVRRLMEKLRQRMGIRRAVALRLSPAVDVPTVLGWREPTLLLPFAACDALERRELETVLAHELAHVRRQDYAANLAQTLVDTLLFFNPAARWISSRIREEREFCCDAVAATAITDRLSVYLRALLALEDLRTMPGHRHALALTGGGLVRRIRKLAEGGRPRTGISRLGYAVLLAGLVTLGATAALAPGPADIGAWVIMTHDLDRREAELRAVDDPSPQHIAGAPGATTAESPPGPTAR